MKNETSAVAKRRSPTGRLEMAALVLATTLCLGPFANKALHIDDPLFFWTARQIIEYPRDPYGFSVNWDVTAQRMSEITKNPPLTAYYLALAGSLLGWSEVPLHLAFLLPAVAAVLGTYRLAARMSRRPLVAALATLLTPAFLVSGSSLMSDSPMLALWVWSVVLWVEGVDRSIAWKLFAGASLAGLGALTKYFGASLIPLLLAYALARRKRPGLCALHLLIPLALLAGYQIGTSALYGRGLLLDAALFVADWRVSGGQPLPLRLLVGLAFTGGCALPALLLAPLHWRRRTFLAGAGTFGAAALACHRWLDSPALATPETSLDVQYGLLATGGIATLALAAVDALRRRDAESVLLGLWVFGTFVFASGVNWTVNGRSVLPMVPAVGILVARRLSDVGPADVRKRRIAVAAALLASAFLSLGVACADLRLANAQRAAVAKIHERTRDTARPVWFQGHWGFQFYMERIGARPIDVLRRRAQKGDTVALPGNNSSVTGVVASEIASRESFEIETGAWISTMHGEVGAGFYSSGFGPLPFVIGKAPAERYEIVTLAR